MSAGTYSKGLKSAMLRSVNEGLFMGPVNIGGKPKLTHGVLKSISRAVADRWPRHESYGTKMPATGWCMPLAARMLPVVQEHVGDDVFFTVGWLHDVVRNKWIWRSSVTDVLCFIRNAISTGEMSNIELHAWLTLKTGEGIDVSVYPTLAERFPDEFKVGDGRVGAFSVDGVSSSALLLPKFEYHPQFIIGEHALSKLEVR